MRPLSSSAASPAVALLVGPSGAGKTTCVQRCVAWAQARGVQVRGLVTPERRDARGRRVKWLQDVSTGEAHPLAYAVAPGEQATVGRWRFVPQTVAWGQQVLRGITATDLFVMDELGPLELQRGVGLSAALDVLRRGLYRLAVVAVRPGLASLLRRRLQAWGVDAFPGPPPDDPAAWERLLSARLALPPHPA